MMEIIMQENVKYPSFSENNVQFFYTLADKTAVGGNSKDLNNCISKQQQ